MDINSFNGERIKEAREHKGLTQEALADKLHVSKQAVSNWENGKNRPDEDTRPLIAAELGIALNYCTITGKKNNMIIKPLSEINDINDLLGTVDNLINTVDIDPQFEVTVKKLLQMQLLQIIGYDCYLVVRLYSEILDGPIGWGYVAADLKQIINSNADDPLPMGGTTFPFKFPDDLMKKKIEWISYQIGGELFEDFDDSGYRDGFTQQIGRIAELYGYDLLNVLPGKDSSLMSVFKTSILSLSETIQELS